MVEQNNIENNIENNTKDKNFLYVPEKTFSYKIYKSSPTEFYEILLSSDKIYLTDFTVV